ncbi:DUF3226 domain-containing protein [Heyndrickxia acidicola]|uniref:DUF3226 domain-containing protein n=1 Tax=Heyndrickxia acidicola TaxID=209389 RepID=A0ABU6ME22_9BACI|nr:DUF3226 domain-containing protein [Heyndrickxia acidicola]MED1201928.1 hypothetical protein [Heyndrickxia acidicola]
MKYIILCEGKTDSILLSYYLIKVQNWVFYKKNEKPISIPIRDKDSEIVSWYKRGEDFLVIWGIGGKDKFDYAIENILKLNWYGNPEQMFDKILVLADRDQETEENKANELSGYFLKRIEGVSLTNKQWTNVVYNNSFDLSQNLVIGCLIVPFDGPGALETFLLQVLSTQDEEEEIILKVREFIRVTESQKYLRSTRQKLKVEFATVMAIMYPEKVFTIVDELLKSIPWEQYTEFQDGFKMLELLCEIIN